MPMRWSYSKALFRQGAYLLEDDDGREVAAIVAADDARPIHAQEANARLLVRECHSSDWQSAGRFTFGDAIRRGNAHAQTCHAATGDVPSAVRVPAFLLKPGP